LGGIRHSSDLLLTLARAGFIKHNCSLGSHKAQVWFFNTSKSGFYKAELLPSTSGRHPGFCKIGRYLCSTSSNSFGPCRSAKSRVPNITTLSQSLEVVISGTPCSLGVTLHFNDLTKPTWLHFRRGSRVQFPRNHFGLWFEANWVLKSWTLYLGP
jgi:hypothetical protein